MDLGLLRLSIPGRGEKYRRKHCKHGLKQLEKVVDTYMQANGIPQNIKNDLINSIVLWNGYESIPWDIKGHQKLWDLDLYGKITHPFPILYGGFICLMNRQGQI